VEKNEITTEEAHELTGYHPAHLWFLARTGKVKARKLGRKLWLFDRHSLLEWQRNARPGPKPRQ
jgi:hypothetical protein